MSHEIDMTTGMPAIAYVGETPWHGLGQKLEEGASIDTWTVSAGLAWRACRTAVEFTLPFEDAPHFMENRHVLYRDDTLAALSVVSDTYKIAQPAQVMDFFRELTEQSDAKMETAGSLHGGKVIWALARLGENLAIMDDFVAPYLLLSTSYDMSTPTLAKFVATRVVCNNTIQIAMREGTKQIRIPHSAEFRTSDIRAGLDISLNEFEAFRQKALKLAGTPFRMSDMDKYLIALLQPVESGEIDSDVIRKSKAYRKIVDLFEGEQIGAEQGAMKSTAWGALNAVTQYIDHVKGNNQSSRLSDAWWGQGATFKERALELLAA